MQHTQQRTGHPRDDRELTRRARCARSGARGGAAVVVAAATMAAPFVGGPFGPGSAAAQDGEYMPYEVEITEGVTVSVDEFVASVADTLSDPRGWTLGGTLDFAHVSDGGLFTVVLATPGHVEAAAPICSSEWSCRVGDRVLINEERWLAGTPGYPLPLSDYRDYVVNHEVGHWLGLDHRECAGFDAEAPVMVQQSKGLGRCRPTVWPIPDEQRTAGEIRGADVRRQRVLSRGVTGAGVAEWQQHLNEVAGRDLLVDGIFGPVTESATQDFERFFALEPEGVVRDTEWGVVNYVLRLQPRELAIGMIGPDVTDWQRDLRQVGQDLVVDGWFGPQTQDRTRNLQRFFGLPETGEADPATRGLVDELLVVMD